MSDLQETQQQPTEVEFDELATLQQRANLMGIKFHPSTGVDKLRAKIENKLANVSIKDDSSLMSDPDIKAMSKNSKDYLTHQEYKEAEFKLRKINAGKLVRVRITCMNPAKKEWDGEIISVGSARMGTYKKFVKFNTEDGWHIPHIIFEYLKDRKCSVFYTFSDHLGQKIRKSKLVNEFSIEVMPPLTKDQLKDLAQRQAMEAGKEV